MGRVIDQNKPFSDEDKEYLRSRGRGYLIPANERIFGVDGKTVPKDRVDNQALSPFYNPEDRAAAVYDVGGAPLPGTVLDYDTGRVADRENGITIEYTGPGHTPGAYDLSPVRDREIVEGVDFESYDVDENGNPVDDHVDQDIVDFVLEHETKADLVATLKKNDIEYSGSAKKEELQDALAVGLQDKRDEGESVSLKKG